MRAGASVNSALAVALVKVAVAFALTRQVAAAALAVEGSDTHTTSRVR